MKKLIKMTTSIFPLPVNHKRGPVMIYKECITVHKKNNFDVEDIILM